MADKVDSFNEDELEAPEWINADFLTKVLNSCETDTDITVNNFKITPASAKGDHYASIMFRIYVEFKQKGELRKKTLIIKTMPEAEGLKKAILEKSSIFEIEIGMYTQILPKFEELLRSVGDKTVLSPKCLYQSLSPKKLIILEDLVPLGYATLHERHINLDEVKMVYSKLAKWHAMSYKIGLENPSIFDDYRYGVMSGTAMINNIMYKDGVKNFVELLSCTPSLVPYVSYFQNFCENILLKCKDSFNEYRVNPQETAFYVLSHGDFHNKNLMFKNNKSTGSLEDVMLLDFQFCYFGPLVNDLIYSFFLILSPEQRQNNVDELLYVYYKEFKQILEKVDFKGPKLTLAALKEQIMKYKHYELFLLTTLLPMFYGFKDGSVDVGSLMSSSEARAQIYKNKDYIKEIEELLPRYLHKGYFEY
ncbi:uncharacterized protein LOC119678998 [Teleopsis dalmanni]|uniref:uncharacterized protein LOC119678998 n=1 Tax=Teleopsis dalmanni TaxID=139649 RepID=UPI0018CDEB9A|nr:uncharacterized protein LOC119678998 [Teleopsis dalmanni]